MKILHTADWHLGKKLYNHDRIDEQRDVLNEIEEIIKSQSIDVVLIAGDIFDSANPSIEATDLLYASLKRMTDNARVPVIAIAGNHDSADRINMPNALARECGIILIGYPHETYTPLKHQNWSLTSSGPGWIELQLIHTSEVLHITTTAFTNEIRLKNFISHDQNEEKGLIEYLSKHWLDISNNKHKSEYFNVLIAHQLIWPEDSNSIPDEDEGERSIMIGHTSVIPSNSIPPSYDYVALGHLHRYQKIDGPTNIFYSGSPLAYSFSESNQEKYAQILHVENSQIKNLEKFKLKSGKKLLTKSFDNLSEAEKWIIENRDHHLEVSIIVDEYITAAQAKTLRDATDNHLGIIPLVRKTEEDNTIDTFDFNSMRDIADTFKHFFKQEKDIEPNEELMNLFNEIIHSSED